jgi:hypothetical protein
MFSFICFPAFQRGWIIAKSRIVLANDPEEMFRVLVAILCFHNISTRRCRLRKRHIARVLRWRSLAHCRPCLGTEVLAMIESQIDAEAPSGAGESS